MLQHRHRLVQRGVRADRLQPEWCRQNTGQCYGSDDNPNGPPPSTEDPHARTTTEEPTVEPESGAQNLGGISMFVAVVVAFARLL